MSAYTLAVLILSFSAFTGQMNPTAAEKYMQIACEYTGGECPAAPLVYATPMRDKLWGLYYRGTNVVWITDRCVSMETDQDFCHGIIIHEMVHYITMKQGRMRDECVNERFAWAIYNQYELSIGRWDLVDLNWRKGYPQCQQEKTDESIPQVVPVTGPHD